MGQPTLSVCSTTWGPKTDRGESELSATSVSLFPSCRCSERLPPVPATVSSPPLWTGPLNVSPNESFLRLLCQVFRQRRGKSNMSGNPCAILMDALSFPCPLRGEHGDEDPCPVRPPCHPAVFCPASQPFESCCMCPVHTVHLLTAWLPLTAPCLVRTEVRVQWILSPGAPQAFHMKGEKGV